MLTVTIAMIFMMAVNTFPRMYVQMIFNSRSGTAVPQTPWEGFSHMVRITLTSCYYGK